MERIIASGGVGLGIIAAFLLLLGFCGPIADYVLPRIPFLRKFVDNLPMMAKYRKPKEPANDYTVTRPFGPFRVGERFRVVGWHDDCGVADILGFTITDDAMLNYTIDQRVLATHCEPIA